MTKNPALAPEATTLLAPEKKVTIGSVVADLLMDATLSYDAIVNLIQVQFADANTSARSVASVAARLRKAGTDVPMRRVGKSDNAA